MKKLLRSCFIAKQAFLKALSVSVFMVSLLLSTSTISAQTINEGFEEAVWTNVTTASDAGNFTGSTINVTTYSTAGSGSTYNTGTWKYSSGYRVSNVPASSTTYQVRTGTYAYHIANSGSAYLITPIIANGITSVTLWMRTASSTGALNLFVATNTTITGNAASASSSATATNGWSNSSGFTQHSSLGYSSISYSVTGNASSLPAYLKFQRKSSEMSIDDVIITTNVVLAAPPTLTAAPSATVDAPFNVTFTDDPAWRAAITSISVTPAAGSSTLSAAAYNTGTASQVTFTPSASSPADLLQTAGSKTITVIATGYTDAIVTQAIGFGGANKLAVTTQPAGPTSNGGTLATQPIVTIQDIYGNTVTSSSASVTAAFDPGFDTWTIGGTTTRSAVSGVVNTFNDLTASAPATEANARIKFTSAGLPQPNITSVAFTIPPLLPLYRSNGTGGGDWNTNSTWEVSNDAGGSWGPAVSTPTSADGQITIRSGDFVDITTGGLSIDEVTVAATGTLDIESTIAVTLNDGPGTDLTINGFVLNAGDVTWNGTVALNGTYVHNTVSASSTAVAQMTQAAASSFIYRGSSTLNVPVTLSGITYGSLSFESTSGLWNPAPTGAGALTVQGTLSAGGGGGNVNLNGGALTGAINITGGVTIFTGSTFVAPTAAVITSVGGTWTNLGTFTAGSLGTVSFTGTGVQTITGNTTFNILNINNTSGTALSVTDGSETGAVVVNAGTTISVGAAGSSLSRTNGNLLVKGKILSSSATTNVFGTTNAQLGFSYGASYTYDGLGATTVANIPAAKWNANSNILITGLTGFESQGIRAATPGNNGTNSAFGNITIDNPSAAVGNRVFGTNWAGNTTINISNLVLGRINGSAVQQMTTSSSTITFNIFGNLIVYAGNWGVASFANATTQLNVSGSVIVDGRNTNAGFANATGFTPPVLTLAATSSSVATLNIGVGAVGGNLTVINGTAGNSVTGAAVLASIVASNTTTNPKIGFVGTGPQSVTGLTGTSIAGNIDVNYIKPSDALTLGSDLTISGTGVLSFLSNGKIITGANTLILSTGATISGASTFRYINGNLAKTFGSGTTPTFTYPVGNALLYAPLTLTATGTTNVSTGTLKVSTTALGSGDAFPTAGSLISLTNRVQRYWTVVNTGLTPTTTITYAAQFNYQVADGNPNNYLAKYTDLTSYYPETISPAATGTVANTTGIGGAGSIGVAGTTNQFIIGESGCIPSTTPTGSTGAAIVCSGNTSTISLTGGSLGTGATVQWYTGSCIGGTPAGSGNGLVVGPGTYYGRYEGTCGTTGCQAVVIDLTNTNTFTGTGNWSSIGNWSCGYAPASGQDVVIANGGHPTLNVNYTAAGTLTLNATSALDIAPTKTLTVSGSADFGGQAVTFKSDATGSGAFGALTGSLSGNTNVTVERFIPTTGRAWRMLTIPVSGTGTIRDAWADGRAPIATIAAAANEPPGFGTLITGYAPGSAAAANAAGFDYIQLPNATSSIRRYVSGDWPTTAAGTPSMTTTYNAAEEGYMLFVRGDRRNVAGVVDIHETVLRPTGALKTGTKNYTLAATLVKLIGNPYASTIDFATIYGHNGTIAEKRFWRWDASQGSNGGYVIVQDNGAGGYETVPNVGGTNLSQIHSGQAFFVRGGTGGILQILESDKVPAGTTVTPPVVFDVPASPGKLFTNMYFDNGTDGLKLIDGVQARFAEGNTIDIDANDVSKISNFNENLALLRNSTSLSVEAHPLVTGEDILYLSATNLNARNYAFQFKSVKMQPGLTAVLQDAYLGKESAISTADNELTTYNFTVTADAASAASNRFRIVFKGGTLPLTLTSAKAYSLNNGIQVDWKTVNERGLRSYEVEKSIDGRSFGKATTVAATGASSYGWYDNAPVKGNNYYRIKGIGTNGEATYSQVLMVNLSSGKSAFSVYPNPVKGGIVGVQFSNMEKGKYALVVYNSAGQKVASRDINHLGGSATEEINLGTMASGVYRVSLISNGGSTQNQTLVIQK